MSEVFIVIGFSILIGLMVLLVIAAWNTIYVVSQSEEYVVERFGKYTRTLGAGLNFIVPFLDRIAHRVSVLERQLPEFVISVITKDNVEVELEATVFYRVTEAY